MMEMLQSRYGNDFMTALHRGDAHGLGGLQAALDALRPSRGNHNKHSNHDGGDHRSKIRAQDVLHEWSLMAALDGLVDDGYRLRGPRE